MESTLKIAHNRDHEDCPVIKIVMPLSLHDKLENPASDVDEKDILLRDFLFKKFTRQTNQWFKIHCNFSAPEENPTHTVSTIRALPQEMLSVEFQDAIIDLLYSAGYGNSDCRFEKVDEFFNWLNGEIRGKKPGSIKATIESVHLDIHSQEYFNAITAPVIELLNTYHPHHSIIIDSNGAELLEGKMVVNNLNQDNNHKNV